jgi:hypothetical protein
MKDVDKLIKGYIEAQPSPQKEILKRVRSLIRDTLPGIEEEFKMGVPWYEGKFYIVGLKDHVNVGFCIDKLSRAELALFEGKGKLMRHIKIRSLEEIDRKKLITLLELVSSRN